MESCARAELLASNYEKQKWQQGVIDVPPSFKLEESVAHETVAVAHALHQTSMSEKIDGGPSLCAVGLMDGIHELPQTIKTNVINNDTLPEIGDRKFELPELWRIFLGQTWRLIFTATACLDLFGLTWSVAAVFASSLAAEFSIVNDANDYVAFLLIFAVVVIPLSCVPIIAQVWIQMVFFAGRMLLVLIMLTTTASAYGASEPHFGNQDGPQQTAPLANFRVLHV